MTIDWATFYERHPRGCGLVDDAPEVRGSHELDELCGAAAGDPNIDRSLLLVDQVMLDQGGTGSCVRHAVARAIQIHARANFDPGYELPSPRYLTAITMALLGTAWNPEGTTIGAVVEAANGSGFCRESQCPWDPAHDGEIYLDEAQVALDQRELRAHRLASEWQERIWDLERAWVAGVGIVIGTDVDESFLRWTGAGTWTMTGPRKGGHAQAVVARKPGAWLLAGSYGPGWAFKGMIYVADEQIASPALTRSIWVVDTVPKWKG